MSTMATLRYRNLQEFDPGLDLLDVGCGTGEFLMAAKQAGHRVVGLDLSEEVITYVKRRHPGLDVRCATLDSSDLHPESIDIVSAFHVVEHVPDPVDLLRQMTRLLRPGGLVYVRVPNLNTWYRRVLGRNWWGFSVEHMSHFTDASLRLAMAEAGLRVVAVRSGDSDLQHSMWPIAPLLLRRRCRPPLAQRCAAALLTGRPARRLIGDSGQPTGRRQETPDRRVPGLSPVGHHGTCSADAPPARTRGRARACSPRAQARPGLSGFTSGSRLLAARPVGNLAPPSRARVTPMNMPTLSGTGWAEHAVGCDADETRLVGGIEDHDVFFLGEARVPERSRQPQRFTCPADMPRSQRGVASGHSPMPTRLSDVP